MNNKPLVKIEYLVDYELSFFGKDDVYSGSELNPLSNLKDINKLEVKLQGKKGFHLSGGSVDNLTKEVSGCLLDGTYEFYKNEELSYKGIMGNALTNENYEFEKSQYIDIKTTDENSSISSLFVYFDNVAVEYATKLSFSNAINVDGTPNNEYTSSTLITNSNLVFIYNFGELSTLKSIRLNFLKWSKKNSLLKILKITTGYTGNYTDENLMKLDFSLNKVNVEDELRFGISSNSGVLQVFDNNKMISLLYKKELIYKNIMLSITVDGTQQGIYFINEKSSEKGSDIWEFDFVDNFMLIQNIKRPMMSLENRNVKQIVDYVLSGIGINISWEIEAMEYCENIQIPKSYFLANQTLYDLLLKCCQIGLLRIYMDRNNVCKITRGV